MQKLVILLTIMLFVRYANAQGGMCIIEKNALYSVMQRSLLDVDSNCHPIVTENLGPAVGETVLLVDVTPDYFIVSEWFGRLSIIKRPKDSTQMVLSSITKGGNIAQLLEDITLDDGQILIKGSAIWITIIYADDKTADALINDDKKINIKEQYFRFIDSEIDINKELFTPVKYYGK